MVPIIFVDDKSKINQILNIDIFPFWSQHHHSRALDIKIGRTLFWNLNLRNILDSG